MLDLSVSAFFSVDEFARTVQLAGAPVVALYDNGYALGSVGTAGMASSGPALTLATADVPANWLGATALVPVGAGTATYQVVAHEPDGSGVSILRLESAA